MRVSDLPNIAAIPGPKLDFARDAVRIVNEININSNGVEAGDQFILVLDAIKAGLDVDKFTAGD